MRTSSTYPKVRFNVVINTTDISVTEYKKEDDFIIGHIVGLSGNLSSNNLTNYGLS